MKTQSRYLLRLLAVGFLFAVIMAMNKPPDIQIPISVQQARLAFPAAARVVPPTRHEADWIWVLGADGQHLGSMVVSSPHTDHVAGYAGPTPLIVAVDTAGYIKQVVLLENTETPSYMNRVMRAGFVDQWDGTHWKNMGAMGDPVESVSGATMTSDAIAETVRYRLALIDPAATVKPPVHWSQRLSKADAVIVTVLAAALLLSILHGRVSRWWRLALLAAAAVLLGGTLTAMVSMALLGGWAVNWQVTGPPTLFLLVLAAVLLPVVMRRNVYCHFICPFGAVQELMFRLTRFRIKVPPKLNRRLQYVPYGILLLAAVVLLMGWSLDVNSLEPFSAFRPHLATAMALTIALISLVLSPAIPRPWCTFGCGTGALLDTLRRPSAKQRRNIPGKTATQPGDETGHLPNRTSADTRHAAPPS